ncbi:Negative elongation factor C/D [Rhizophlyctis rosea]|nr:Negative elongation factor C/D [Rhizophlyctis rosea]
MEPISIDSEDGEAQRHVLIYDDITLWSKHITDVLKDELPKVPEVDIKRWVQENLAPTCCQDIYSYVHAQKLLAGLYLDPESKVTWAKNLRRVSQELAELVADKEDAQLINEAIWFAGKFPPLMLRSLGEIIRNRKATAGEINNLYRYYIQDESLNHVDLIRDYFVLEPMVSDVFSPKRSSEGMDERLFLIALASAGGPQQENKQNVDTTLAALKAFEALTGRVTSEMQFNQNVDEFGRALEFPVTSMAYIVWLRDNLVRGSTFYDWRNLQQQGHPLMFHLLDEASTNVVLGLCMLGIDKVLNQIATRYPLHRPYVAEIWYKLLEHDFSTYTPMLAMLFRQYILDRLIFLLQRGYVTPVLQFMVSASGRLEERSKAYFVAKIAMTTHGPYKKEVVVPMLEILKQLPVQAFRNLDMPDAPAALKRFLDMDINALELDEEDADNIDRMRGEFR